MTKKLLSDKWENAYLNEALHESLMNLRGQFFISASDSTSKAHEYFKKHLFIWWIILPYLTTIPML